MSFTSNIEDIIERNENGRLSVAEHWRRVRLTEIGEVQNGYPFDSTKFNAERGIPLVRIRDVTSGKTATLYDGVAPPGYLIQDGDILVGMDGDFNVRRWRGPEALLNQRVCRVTVDESLYDFRFMYYCLPGYLDAINASTPSITVKHLSSKTLGETPFPLAPLAEQKVIADKLDALLAQVDTLKARLDAIPAILKRFRQSVLSAAVTGKLTEEWRGTGIEDWESVSLNDIGDFGRGKSKHRPRNDPKLFGGEVPFIQTGDVANSGGLIRSHSQTYSAFGVVQSKVWPANTLCITIAANIADTAILTYPACFPDSIVGFAADPSKCLVEFVKWVVDNLKQELERNAPATAQRNINLSILEEVKFQLPPLPEQTEIVRRVVELFGFADQIEARVHDASARVKHLTQSILAKAFRGELTEEWRKANPELVSGENSAEALLERIRAVRAKAPQAKAKRGRKARDEKALIADYSEKLRTRIPTGERRMSKTRTDEDVMGKAYLAGCIATLGGKAKIEELFQASNLALPDFYKQLAWEVRQGMVKDLETAFGVG